MSDNIMTPEEFLAHHGVKGMKWGVRNDKGHEGESAKTKTIKKLDKKYDKSLSGVQGYIKVNNAVASRINPRLDAMNSKPEYQGDLTKNPKLHKKYINEYRDNLQKSLQEAMDDIGTNASGTQRVHIVMTGEGIDTTFEAYTEAIKHDITSGGRCKIKVTFDKNGKITGQNLVPMDDAMTHSDEDETFLAHYGVPGMKWGVRKARTGNLGTRAARAKRYANGSTKLIDRASAIGNYGLNDLVKGRGLHTAAERHAKVYEAERKRLAKGEATAKDILKAYGDTAINLSIYAPLEVGRIAATMRDSKKTRLNNRNA